MHLPPQLPESYVYDDPILMSYSLFILFVAQLRLRFSSNSYMILPAFFFFFFSSHLITFIYSTRAHMYSHTRLQVWVAQYAPHMSVYTPIYVASGPAAVPSPLSIGNLFRYDPKSTFWQACSVGNWAAQAFKYAIVDVRAAQQALEQRVLSEQVFPFISLCFDSFSF